MLAVSAAIVMLVNGVLCVSHSSAKMYGRREVELKVIPVLTMLNENLQRLIELSMAATDYSSRASCMAAQLPRVRAYYYFQMMSLLIVYEH